MSKAREIIEERFAKGEISSEEFDHLIAKIDSKSGSGSDTAAPRHEEAPQPQPSRSIWGVLVGAVGAAFIVWLASLFFKFSAGVGLLIWIVIVGIGIAVETHEYRQNNKST